MSRSINLEKSRAIVSHLERTTNKEFIIWLSRKCHTVTAHNEVRPLHLKAPEVRHCRISHVLINRAQNGYAMEF